MALIPIVLALSHVQLVSKTFMIVLNQVLITIEVVLISMRILFNEYLKSMVKLSEVKKDITEGKPEQAKQKIGDNVSEILDTSKEIAKEIIEKLTKPKDAEKPDLTNPENNPIPENRISVR